MKRPVNVWYVILINQFTIKKNTAQPFLALMLAEQHSTNNSIMAVTSFKAMRCLSAGGEASAASCIVMVLDQPTNPGKVPAN